MVHFHPSTGYALAASWLFFRPPDDFAVPVRFQMYAFLIQYQTCCAGVSGLFMCFLWITKLHPVPKVDNRFFKALLVVAAFHTVGHVAACTSFGQMAVSFAHIVKSAEPVFSVALAGPILKETYPYYVWLSLVPIVAGCGLSAMKEVSFAWNGFNNAMLSNIGMVLRNIYSKKALGDYKVTNC